MPRAGLPSQLLKKVERQATRRRQLSQVDQSLYRLLRVGNPWQVLATACLLKVTRKEQVYPLLARFFRRYPTPQRLLAGRREPLRRLLFPLGLWRKRAQELRLIAHRLSAQGPPHSREEVEAFYGVGEYVADCYGIFVLHDYSHQPRDYALKHYVTTVGAADLKGNRHGPRLETSENRGYGGHSIRSNRSSHRLEQPHRNID